MLPACKYSLNSLEDKGILEGIKSNVKGKCIKKCINRKLKLNIIKKYVSI